MKSKLLTIFSFSAVVYGLPLLKNIRLLLSIQIFFLIGIASVLFLTQPAFSMKESQQNKNKDKYSILFILISTSLIQLVMVIEWAYFRTNFHYFYFDAMTILGIILLTGGTIFRILCIHSLGKYFTATVQTKDSQQLVSDGIYKFIRHPSYLGAYLAITGSTIFMHTYFTAIFSMTLMFFTYKYRIRIEEDALKGLFGTEYSNYQKITFRLFPFIY